MPISKETQASETKGQVTKNHILKEGLFLASTQGLVNISIGSLAAKTGMSRSGLFAHFMSKEQLQLEILEYAYKVFHDTITIPLNQISSPREKLQFLVHSLPAWFEQSEPSIPGGCIFINECVEFDDRPGKVRDYLMLVQSNFRRFLRQTYKEAVQRSEFSGVMDEDDFAFCFYSLCMGYHHYKKFFRDETALSYVERHLFALIEYSQGIQPTYPK